MQGHPAGTGVAVCCCGPHSLMADSAMAADKANKGLLGPDVAGVVALHRENFEW